MLSSSAATLGTGGADIDDGIGRMYCRLSKTPKLLGLALFAAALLPQVSRAADPPDRAKPRGFVTPRIGLGFPGEATPSKISTTKLGVGFVLHPDAVVAIGDYFEVGGYLHYSIRGITDRGTAPTDGLNTHLFSTGAVAKVGFDIAHHSRLRVGLMLGYNFTKQGFRNANFEGDITANGLNVGPDVEWSILLTRQLALNLQLAAITQVAGTADLGPIGAVVEGGSKQKMAYPPLAFFAVGVEFGLGERR